MIVDCAAYVDGRREDVPGDPASLAAWAADRRGYLWLGLRMPSEAELGEYFRERQEWLYA